MNCLSVLFSIHNNVLVFIFNIFNGNIAKIRKPCHECSLSCAKIVHSKRLEACIRTNWFEWMMCTKTIDHDIANRWLNLIYFGRKHVCLCVYGRLIWISIVFLVFSHSRFTLALSLSLTFYSLVPSLCLLVFICSLFSRPLEKIGTKTATTKNVCQKPGSRKKMYVNTFTENQFWICENGKWKTESGQSGCYEFPMRFCVSDSWAIHTHTDYHVLCSSSIDSHCVLLSMVQHCLVVVVFLLLFSSPYADEFSISVSICCSRWWYSKYCSQHIWKAYIRLWIFSNGIWE